MASGGFIPPDILPRQNVSSSIYKTFSCLNPVSTRVHACVIISITGLQESFLHMSEMWKCHDPEMVSKQQSKTSFPSRE